ncbi:uncharacterized protein L969DRAFT_15464 [Mixia osmundae IAM 14324]|uniref:PHD-type domain-containing protein n=1 Tax=Mixia osmundae (strain CBS 9802 / IAM 14324 / JCM 22182 / KY 12970) TaxID=764103 RepID=G7DY81_MIXOS|nr:uncharacterized protein L969DRAFT_15464 [Mixia osmundae IAM 14324]KEI41444.1 hypothetical protein L969DRAFT_15464 [Mixia osmundae IAM 14324]GAA95541.1 hypothetical protein E5Q_02196 [Mixia osmundae IAM 14324]
MPFGRGAPAAPVSAVSETVSQWGTTTGMKPESLDDLPGDLRALRIDWRIAAISQWMCLFGKPLAQGAWDVNKFELDLIGVEPDSICPSLLASLLLTLTGDRHVTVATHAAKLQQQYLRRSPEVYRRLLATVSTRLEPVYDEDAEQAALLGQDKLDNAQTDHDAPEQSNAAVQPTTDSSTAVNADATVEREMVEVEVVTPRAWSDLDMFEKIEVIYQLCQWHFVDPDRFRKMINVDAAEEMTWRVEPVGWDADSNTYWLFDDNRLWIQRYRPLKPWRTPTRPVRADRVRTAGSIKKSASKPAKSRNAPRTNGKIKTATKKSTRALPKPLAESSSRSRSQAKRPRKGYVTSASEDESSLEPPAKPEQILLTETGRPMRNAAVTQARPPPRIRQWTAQSSAWDALKQPLPPRSTRTARASLTSIDESARASPLAKSKPKKPVVRGVRASRRGRGAPDEDEWQQPPKEWLEDTQVVTSVRKPKVELVDANTEDEEFLAEVAAANARLEDVDDDYDPTAKPVKRASAGVEEDQDEDDEEDDDDDVKPAKRRKRASVPRKKTSRRSSGRVKQARSPVKVVEDDSDELEEEDEVEPVSVSPPPAVSFGARASRSRAAAAAKPQRKAVTPEQSSEDDEASAAADEEEDDEKVEEEDVDEEQEQGSDDDDQEEVESEEDTPEPEYVPTPDPEYVKMPANFIEWEAICVTLEQWETVLSRFTKPKHLDERALIKHLRDEVLPPILLDLREKERLKKKEEAIANRKRSSRILVKEAEMEQKRAQQAAQQALMARMESSQRAEGNRADGSKPTREEEPTREARLKERDARKREREERLLQREVEAVQEAERRAEREKEREEAKARGEPLPQDSDSATPQSESWYLDCEICGKAGQNLDDGKQIIACDKCGVWQHATCWDRNDAALKRARRNWSTEDFLCSRCSGTALSLASPMPSARNTPVPEAATKTHAAARSLLQTSFDPPTSALGRNTAPAAKIRIPAHTSDVRRHSSIVSMAPQHAPAHSYAPVYAPGYSQAPVHGQYSNGPMYSNQAAHAPMYSAAPASSVPYSNAQSHESTYSAAPAQTPTHSYAAPIPPHNAEAQARLFAQQRAFAQAHLVRQQAQPQLSRPQYSYPPQSPGISSPSFSPAVQAPQQYSPIQRSPQENAQQSTLSVQRQTPISQPAYGHAGAVPVAFQSGVAGQYVPLDAQGKPLGRQENAVSEQR